MNSTSGFLYVSPPEQFHNLDLTIEKLPVSILKLNIICISKAERWIF